MNNISTLPMQFVATKSQSIGNISSCLLSACVNWQHQQFFVISMRELERAACFLSELNLSLENES